MTHENFTLIFDSPLSITTYLCTVLGSFWRIARVGTALAEWGPDDSNSFIRATFPRQTYPHPHNLLVFATPCRRWRGGVLLGQNVYDTSARRGTTAGYSRCQGEFHSGTARPHHCAPLALQGRLPQELSPAPPALVVSQTRGVVDAVKSDGAQMEVQEHRYRGRVCTSTDCTVLALPGSHTSTVAEKPALMILDVTHGGATG
ncbi:hypothetical protein K438DRAFT_1822275 [Mycena galopus ATCC 62051]|nr:hypothetical protein K438DRAFT_1822275 [Mycena galopus ATCC 62051]